MSRRHFGLIAGAVVAMLVGGLVVVVARAESPPTAGEALVSAKRFVEKADSVEYHGESRTEYHDPEFPEDDFTDKSTFEEAARFPDEARSIAEFDAYVTESIVADEITYTREAERRRDLEDEQWKRFEPSEEDDDLFFFTATFLVPASELQELIGAATRPRLLAQNDERSLVRVRVNTDEFEEIYYPTVRLDLVIEDSGRVTDIGLRAGDEYETQRASIEIQRWNGEVEIEAPDESDIDPTPLIDEEDTAAFDDAPLYQPRVLPSGFALQSAYVIPEGDPGDFEGEEVACDQVDLYFLSDTAFEEFDEDEFPTSTFLDLFQYPTSCSKERPDDAQDFVAGPYTGWFEDEDGYLYGQITVGDTIVEFNTDLDVATLMTTLADLVPLDFTTLPIAPPEQLIG